MGLLRSWYIRGGVREGEGCAAYQRSFEESCFHGGGHCEERLKLEGIDGILV